MSVTADPSSTSAQLSGGAVGDFAMDARFGADRPSSGGLLGKYLATLIRYKWWALALLVMGTATGVILSRKVKPTYLVQAKIWFDQSQNGPRGPIQEGQLFDAQSWIDLLRSYAVLDEVVIEQKLYLTYEAAHKNMFGNFSLQERFRPGTYRLRISPDGRSYMLETGTGGFIEKAAFGDSLGRALGFNWIPPRKRLDPKDGLLFSVSRPRDRARLLASELVTSMPTGAEAARRQAAFMQIELRGRDPIQLTNTLNALLRRFVSMAAELKRSRLKEFESILSDQLRVAEQNLQAAEIGLESARINNVTQPTTPPTPAPGGTVESGSQLTNYMTQKLQQEQLRQDRAALQRILGRGQVSPISVTEVQGIASVQSAPELEAALTELTTKRASLRALQYRYTDDYKDVRTLKGELATLESSTIPRLMSELVAELDRREGQIQTTMAAVTTEMRAIPARVMEEARLTRQVTIADGLYTMLRQRHEEARLAALSSTPDVRVVDEAVVPTAPVEDASSRVILMAIVLSLAVVAGGVFLLEMLDPHVRYPEHVTHGMQLPILTAIPRLKTGKTGRSRDNTAAVVEAFRTLRLSVLQARGNAGTLVLSITSPGTGDGKSFVAMNLAFALADQGYRTLLIDGDVRRGSLHHLVETTRKPGLTDLLAGAVTREQAIRHTAYPLLDLIPCGKRVQAGPELLGSQAFTDLVQQMRGQYSIVLIDSPPMGAGVDPFVLGMAAGTLLMVVRTGQSDREFAAAKLAALDRLPVRILGAVLNGVPTERAYRYYSYLAGYESNEEIEVERGLPVPS